MAHSGDVLDRVYARTRGRCHICRASMVRKNYGRSGHRGAWEVDHSRPRTRGGSDHLNNLYPACISCNRTKGASSSRTARRMHGHSRSPMSERQAARARANAAFGWGGAAFVAGRILGLTPVGLLLTTAFTALLAHSEDPDTQ